jgi:hypothetical protein
MLKNLLHWIRKKSSRKLLGVLFAAGLAIGQLFPLSPSSYAVAQLDAQPPFGKVGNSVEVSGEGFGHGASLEIFFDQTKVASAKADGEGNLKGISFNIPCALANQRHTLSARKSSGEIEAETSIFVQPIPVSLIIKSDQPKPGGDLEVSGKGFLPNEEINFVFGQEADSSGIPAGQLKADKNGNVGAQRIKIPGEIKGEKATKLSATGQCSQSSANSSLYLQGLYPEITPSDYAPKVGNKITFSGSGFAPGENIRLYLGDYLNTQPLRDFRADENGSFKNQGEYQIPKDFPTSGVSTFTLVGDKSQVPVQTRVSLQELSGSVTLSTYYGLPGNTSITFNGEGFIPNERVDVYLGASDQSKGKLVSVISADERGNFEESGEYTLSFGTPAGEGTFTLIGRESAKPKKVAFNIGAFSANVTPSSFSPLPGETVTFSGSGFPANEPVQIYLNDELIGEINADWEGKFQDAAETSVPYGLGGQGQVKAVGTLSGASALQNLAVQPLRPSVTPNSYFGLSGSVITLQGESFAPSEKLEVVFDELEVSEAQSNENGAFEDVTFSIPPNVQNGEHTVSVVGETSKASASFPFTVGEDSQ